jgi:hypothetical protein
MNSSLASFYFELTVSALVCLISAWATLSNAPRKLRFGAAGVLLAMHSLAGISDLVVTWLTCLVTLGIGNLAWAAIMGRRAARFTDQPIARGNRAIRLSSIFVLLLVFATCFAAVRANELRHRETRVDIGLGLCWTALAATAWIGAWSNIRWYIKLGLQSAAAIIAALAWNGCEWLSYSDRQPLFAREVTIGAGYRFPALMLLTFAVLLVVRMMGNLAVRSTPIDGGNATRRRPAIEFAIRITALALGAFVLLPGTLGMVYLVSSPRPLTSQLLEGNGYRSAVELSERPDETSLPTSFLDEPDSEQVDRFVEANQARLGEIEGLLTLPWQAPVIYHSEIDIDTTDMMALGRLRRSLDALARWHLARDEVGRAVDIHVTSIRLGLNEQRGGLLIHSLLGNAQIRSAIEDLFDMLNRLNIEQCHELIDVLADAEQGQELSEAARAREEVWMRIANGWRGQFDYLSMVLAERLFDKKREIWMENNHRDLADQRLLMAHIALRWFKIDNNRYPDRIEELARQNVHTASLDPFTGRPLCYRRTDDGYVLYSAGDDQTDDGGNLAATESLGKGNDQFLERLRVDREIEAKQVEEAITESSDNTENGAEAAEDSAGLATPADPVD